MFDAESLIQVGGLLAVLLAIYGQTGLFFCFFLPSGVLLFMAGVLIATDSVAHSFFTVCTLGILASVLGSMTSYLIGYKAGTLLYNKSDSGFFKKQHLTSAQRFFDKYGSWALSIGVFFPVIRTFGPMVAGIIQLQFSRVCFFALLGAIGWIVSFAAAGYLIGSMPFLRPYLNYVVGALLIAVTTPVVSQIVRGLKENANSDVEGNETVDS